MALYVHCPGLIERSSTFLWLKHVISTASSAVLENLGKRPYQVIMQRYVLSYRNRPPGVTRANAFQVGCPNIPSSATILKQISDDQQNPEDPFAAPAEFKVVLENNQENGPCASFHVRHRTAWEPSSWSLPLLCGLTGTWHLGTLIHCCEAWEPVRQCFDQNSFECIDFHGLSQILASLTRERLSEEKLRINHFIRHRRKRQRLGKVQIWSSRLALRKTEALSPRCYQREDGHPLENDNENESGRRLCEYWCTIFQVRVESERHHCLETILSYAQRAPDSICWEIDGNEFDELLAIKKKAEKTAPGLDGFHTASTDVPWEAWVLGFSTAPINMSLRVA